MADHPQRNPIGLFQRFGVELEYMIVDRESLDVRPITDEVIRAVTGEYTSDAEPDGDDGPVSWSNELTAHVIELKTQRPAASLDTLAPEFHRSVRRINEILRPMGACLLPTAMHPWMDPLRETHLWKHEYDEVYALFDRIFSCKGHGWANLQSAHINLPFANDEEFGRLHAAIRVVLPLIPALAASSPIADERITGFADTRLEHYRNNSRRIPSMTGMIVPEPVFTREAYEREILEQIYRDTAAHDPEGILRYEWANARGCIARFDRGAIEIRLVDVQECPRADLAIVALIVHAVRELVEERHSTSAAQRALPTDLLHHLLRACITDGERAMVTDRALLRVLGLPSAPMSAGGVWARLADRAGNADAVRLVRGGTLSTRILRAVGDAPSRQTLHQTYADLASCLDRNEFFGVDAP